MRNRILMSAMLVLALLVAVPASAGPLWQVAGHPVDLDGMTFGLWSHVMDGMATVGRVVDELRPERIGAAPDDDGGQATTVGLDDDGNLRPERIGNRAKAR